LLTRTCSWPEFRTCLPLTDEAIAHVDVMLWAIIDAAKAASGHS